MGRAGRGKACARRGRDLGQMSPLEGSQGFETFALALSWGNGVRVPAQAKQSHHSNQRPVAHCPRRREQGTVVACFPGLEANAVSRTGCPLTSSKFSHVWHR